MGSGCVVVIDVECWFVEYVVIGEVDSIDVLIGV